MFLSTPLPSLSLRAAAALTLACALPAHAAGVVGTGTPASCTEAALVAALAGGGAVTFSCGAAPHTIVFTGQKNLSASTSIDGGGLITLDGNQAHILFYMNNALNLTLSGLTLAQGRSPTHGAAIYAQGPGALTLTDVNLANNEAAQYGGAILAYNGVALNLTRVRATGNRAGQRGGVIFTLNSNDTITLNQFVASGNHAALAGGAIHHQGGTMLISNSLFAGNSVTSINEGGGAIDVRPAGGTNFTITNSTFHGNTVASGASGSAIRALNAVGGDIVSSTFANHSGADAIRTYGATALTLRNTIVANTEGQPNCVTQNTATVTDGGNNLQFGGSAAQSCGASIPELNPQLAPLADNGGFSQTLALNAGSPAIDAGSGCPAADQRGVARPIGPACDIGAHEGPAPVVGPPGPGNGAISVPTLDAAGLALLALLLPVAVRTAARKRRG